MRARECFVCKKCKGHHWDFLNAIECCQDLSEERIKERIDKEASYGICAHCNTWINKTHFYRRQELMGEKEICHVCKREKKPYIVFMNMDLMNMINHDMAREDGPICERCNSYFAMTLEFKDPTDEEFELARKSTRFAQAMLKWWTKDKDFSKQPADDYMDPEPKEDKRNWGGTHDIAKWYRKEYGSQITGKVKA